MSTAPSVPTSITTDAVDMVFQLLAKTIVITADDGQTLLTPGVNIVLVKGPYTQEGAGYQPQIIVGPRRPSRRAILTLPPSWYEIDDMVPVRILTRDNDGNQDGFTLDGRATRAKILQSVWQTFAKYYRDPDGSGTWTWVRPTDNGTDSDAVPDQTQGAIPLYRTDIVIGCRRYSQTD